MDGVSDERMLHTIVLLGIVLLGKTIAHYTRNIYIRNKVLYVEISSSVVKNELFMMREEIKRKINEKEGEEIIRTIIFK